MTIMLPGVGHHRQPVVISRAYDDEPRVQDVFLGIVGQWFAVELQDSATRLLDDCLRGCRIPFGRQSEACLQAQ